MFDLWFTELAMDFTDDTKTAQYTSVVWYQITKLATYRQNVVWHQAEV